MKQFSLVTLAVTLFFAACNNKEVKKSSASAETKTAVVNTTADSLAIAEALHGFFTWYDANETRLGKIEYVNDKGKHLVLDEKQLMLYHAEVKKSGFVSDDFIADEKKFYQACSKAWAKERKDEVPTGLEADRYHCAQDFVAPYNTGAVTSIINGDHADVVLTLSAGGSKSDFKFEMKKENGKWLLSKIGCDMGVKY